MAGGRAATDAVIQGRAAISVNDPGHPTPPGWERVALTNVAELGTGHTPSRKHPEYWGGGIPWIGIRDAGACHGGVIYDTAQHTNELGLANSAARLLPEGTICLSRTASVGYVVMMGRPMATSQDFVTWTCGDALEPRFLMQALLAEGDDIRRFGEGSTHTTIYFPEVKAFHIDLPPKPEQRRIVAKIDSLSAKSKRARGRLDHVPRLVARYKKAVLGLIFGQLTGPNRPLGERAEFVTSGSRGWANFYSEEGPLFIRVGNVTRSGVDLDFSEAQHVQPPANAEGRRTRVLPGDVLVTITADLGRVGVVPEGLGESYVNQHVALIRLRDASDGRFVAWYLSSPEGQKQLFERDRGVTRAGLGLDDIRAVQLPEVSTSQQAVTLRRIEAAFAWIDRLAAEAISARKLIDLLDQAVLAKAFRGELVPQDPADEPASVLLERIKAAKTGTVSAGTRRGRPRQAALL